MCYIVLDGHIAMKRQKNSTSNAVNLCTSESFSNLGISRLK